MAPPGFCPQCRERLPADVPHGICPKCMLGLGFDEPLTRRDSALLPTGEPGTGFTPPSPAELAGHFPQLEVLELIGQGGMGAVYRARQRTLDRTVALKILPAEVGRDPAFAERFTREAQALARLTHPHIVVIFDFGESHGLYYFLMEYVDGVNLRASLRTGRLTPHEALAIVPQVCDALQYAHDQGIVHRDIKPENVLLDRHGRVKIADFGLAKLLGRPHGRLSLTGTGQVMGTPHYMAPEQFEKPMSVDHRADIYSLGVVFYELLTGELPLGRFAPPSEKADVSGELDDVVLRTLEKEPDRRYQHASDVKTAVECLRGGDVRVMAAPRVAAATPTRLRVPFTIGDVYGGWARADGILRFDGQALVLEFQVKDEVVGCVSSAVKNVAVPVAEIVSLDWVPGWFAARATLELRVDRLETLQRVPRSERGCVRLRIARADAPAAQQLLNAVRDADRPAGAGYAAAIPAETASRSLDPSRRDRAAQDVRGPATGLLIVGALDCLTVLLLLLLLPLVVITDMRSVPQASPRDTLIEVTDPISKERAYPLLSAGQDAEGRRVHVEELGPESHHVTVIAQPVRSAEIRQPTIALSLIALALGLIPLVSGLAIMLGALRMKHLKSYELGIAAAILAIVPLHPWAILGLPIGIWTLIVLHRSDVKTLFAERARRPAPASGPGQDRVHGGLLPMVVVVLGLLLVSALVVVGMWTVMAARSTPPDVRQRELHDVPPVPNPPPLPELHVHPPVPPEMPNVQVLR